MKLILPLLQETANILCDRDHLEHVEVKPFTFADDNFYGKADVINKVLFVNEKLMARDALMTVYHEFRHYWQYYNCNDVFVWWLRKEHQAFYKKFYSTPFCSIERDAETFGISLGKQNCFKLIQEFSPKELDVLFSSEFQLRAAFELRGWTFPEEK